jgi:hypothetical protein
MLMKLVTERILGSKNIGENTSGWTRESWRWHDERHLVGLSQGVILSLRHAGIDSFHELKGLLVAVPAVTLSDT